MSKSASLLHRRKKQDSPSRELVVNTQTGNWTPHPVLGPQPQGVKETQVPTM